MPVILLTFILHTTKQQTCFMALITIQQNITYEQS